MVPRISRCMKALKWKRSLGAGRASPRKVAAKAWASALIITASSTETQKDTITSTARFWGSRIKGTGQAVSKDITLTLVLLNNREGRNSSLPSQFTRLVGKNYPLKGSDYLTSPAPTCIGLLVTRETTTATISTMAERMKAQVREPVMSLMVPANRVMKKPRPHPRNTKP